MDNVSRAECADNPSDPRDWPAWTDNWHWATGEPAPRLRVVEVDLPVRFLELARYAHGFFPDTKVAFHAAAEAVLHLPEYAQDEVMCAAARRVLDIIHADDAEAGYDKLAGGWIGTGKRERAPEGEEGGRG